MSSAAFKKLIQQFVLEELSAATKANIIARTARWDDGAEVIDISTTSLFNSIADINKKEANKAAISAIKYLTSKYPTYTEDDNAKRNTYIKPISTTKCYIITKNPTIAKSILADISNHIEQEGIYSYTSQELSIASNSSIRNASILQLSSYNNKQPLSYSLKKVIGLTTDVRIPYAAEFFKSSNAAKLGLFSFKYEVPFSDAKGKYKKAERNILNQLSKDISSWKTSKTIDDIVDETLVDSFKGKPKKAHSSNTKTKGIIKSKAKINHKQARFAFRDSSGRFANILNIKNLINLRLHDQIQKNMGKGNAKTILNYRTGRFAKSAEVTTLDVRRDKVTAFYTFMHYPYDTFAPGGAQSSPASRDPNKLIGRSIRQLAKQLINSKFSITPVAED